MASNRRLAVNKTYKLYIGGSFVRSESGRVLPCLSAEGRPLDKICNTSRKDLRDAVTAARGAFDGWAKKTAYLRGQILYRAAEMLQSRSAELVHEIERSTDVRRGKAESEVTAAIDRLVYYAGWTDKYAQLFGTVNPVATSHFNFSTPEPTGVAAVMTPDAPSLLPLVSLLAPVILSGNSAVVMVSERFPLPALAFAEILATSDLPGGVINLLSGKRAELASHLACHMDINAIVDGSGDSEMAAQLQAGSGFNLKRYTARNLHKDEWLGEAAENPYWILDTVEFKTAWHPIGV